MDLNYITLLESKICAAIDSSDYLTRNFKSIVDRLREKQEVSSAELIYFIYTRVPSMYDFVTGHCVITSSSYDEIIKLKDMAVKTNEFKLAKLIDDSVNELFKGKNEGSFESKLVWIKREYGEFKRCIICSEPLTFLFFINGYGDLICDNHKDHKHNLDSARHTGIYSARSINLICESILRYYKSTNMKMRESGIWAVITNINLGLEVRPHRGILNSIPVLNLTDTIDTRTNCTISGWNPFTVPIRCIFTDVLFYKCKFNYISFKGSIFRNVTFLNCCFENYYASFEGSESENVVIIDCVTIPSSTIFEQLSIAGLHINRKY